MTKKILIVTFSIIIVLIILFFVLLGPKGLLLKKPIQGTVQNTLGVVGINVKDYNVSINSPSPYPRSETEERVLLWQEEINLSELLDFENIDLNEIVSQNPDLVNVDINYSDFTLDNIRVRFDFNKFNVKGYYTDDIYYEIDYGECDLNAPEGYTRTLIGPNTIAQRQIVTEDSETVSAGSSQEIPCGVISGKKRIYSDHDILPDDTETFLTYSQLYENRDKYLEGDFIVIKDNNNKVIYLSNNSQNSLPFIHLRYKDSVKIELYGNNEDVSGIESSLGFNLNKIIFIYSLNDNFFN